MLTPKQVKDYQSQLKALYKQIEESINLNEETSKPVALDQTLQGRLSRGDALQQQEMGKANLIRNKKQLASIQAALKRIEDDEYGECFACGDDISVGRLTIMPDATLCIACKEKAEPKAGQ
ncbi:MAG: TraR/DksA family transcriptional regulator [Agarilytica sp.]